MLAAALEWRSTSGSPQECTCDLSCDLSCAHECDTPCDLSCAHVICHVTCHDLSCDLSRARVVCVHLYVFHLPLFSVCNGCQLILVRHSNLISRWVWSRGKWVWSRGRGRGTDLFHTRQSIFVHILLG